jgi:site-specific recombinase XerD
MTIEELTPIIISKTIEEFLNDRVSKRLALNTLKSYNQELKFFQQYLTTFEITNLGEINPDVIRKYLTSLSSHRKNLHQPFTVIRIYLNWLWEEYELESRNPVSKVHVKMPSPQPKEGVKPSDVAKLLTVCVGRYALRDKVIFLVLFDSCLRASELLSLNVGDLDLEASQIFCSKTKNGKPRIVYLGSETKKYIRKYLRERNNPKPEEPLFLNYLGKRLLFFGLREILIRKCKKAGLPILNLHSFRRGGAKSLLNQGVNLRIIQSY